MKLYYTLTLVYFQYCFTAYAQNMECGTDAAHSYLMQNDSAYRNHVLSVESHVSSILNSGQNEWRAVYTIPVVVHVIHLGEPIGTGTNISDAQIQGAIAGLNDRWRNNIGNGVDVEMEFCLATRDPNGNATTGINRVDGSGVTNYSAMGINLSGCAVGALEDNVKSLSRWPVSDYYNIWIVNSICNGQWGGWTYYPYGGPNDGATIVYAYFSYSNTITTHEVGHGFYAYHTFEGDGGNAYCPPDSNCSTTGDRVCDTPPHKQSDCGASNPCSLTGNWDDSRYNYMSYCGSLDRFTQGQKDRMRAVAIVSPRSALLTSLGCSSPLNVENATAFESSVSVYPNPVTDKLFIKSFFENAWVTIYDVLGRTEMNSIVGSQEYLDISNLPTGVHQLRIACSKGFSVKTFLKTN